jgi:hypothetical protein
MRTGWVSERFGLPWGVLAALAMSAVPARGATVWHVKADGSGDVPTIQAAIDAAASGDTVLILPGTYAEHCRVDAKTLVFHGQNGAAETVLDGELSGRLLLVNAGEVTLEGLTFQNGLKTGVEVDNQGAGLAAFQSFVRIRDCVFQGNAAALGGAVFVGSSSAPQAPSASGAVLQVTLWVENTLFLGNIATEAGGGLHSDEVPSTIEDCTFQGNHAGQLGGGIDLLHADHFVQNCRFESNNALDGAGLSWSGLGVLSLNQDVFEQNTASTFGGGVWAMNATGLFLDHVWFLENHAARGGGAYLSHVDVTGTRSLWRGNGATDRGGGAYLDAVTGGAIGFSTWLANTAPSGAAFFTNGGELHLSSCIVGEELSTATQCAGGTSISAECTVGGLATGNCFSFVARAIISGCDADPEFLCSVPSPGSCGPVGHATATCPAGTCPTPARPISWGTLKARYRP